jgi:hypothetical protein
MAHAGGNGFEQSWRSRVWVNTPHAAGTNANMEMFLFGMTHEGNWPADSTNYHLSAGRDINGGYTGTWRKIQFTWTIEDDNYLTSGCEFLSVRIDNNYNGTGVYMYYSG